LYLSITGNQALESFVGTRLVTIEQKYRDMSSSIQQLGDQFIKRMEDQIKSGWGWHSYLPPESRGALIKSIIDAVNKSSLTNSELKKSAAFSINELMSTTQSTRHLNKTLERITFSIGEQSDRNQAVQLINSIVSGTTFENCVDRCETRLAATSPLKGRPFLRNDDPEIRIAELPLHHPGYFT
jgi:hypothetical protein